MPIKLANNAAGQTVTALAPYDTGVVLTTGQGALFPSLAAGEYFYATLASSGNTYEIVKVTAKVNDTFTIVRAQEGTTALSFSAGVRLELRVTAQSVRDAIDDVTASAVGFTPTGGLAATDVQAALAEVDTEKVAFTRLDDSDGSSLVGYTQGGAGASTRTVQAKLRDTVSVKDFGAVGDGVADDTTAIQAAFSQTGRTVYIPTGTYVVSSTLTPTCAAIVGEGELASVIKPTVAVTKVFSIGATGYPTFLSSFGVNGTSTTNATGIFFGDTGSCACRVETVRVTNFAGASAVGIRIGNMLKSQFDKVTTQACGTGLRSQYVTSGYPTTIQFNSCVFTDSSVNGANIVDGWNLTFINCDFESSGQEGVKILPASAGVANNIVFQGCWFEANYGTNTAQYQFVAGDGTALGGANINPILRDCYFSTSGSSAKPIRMNGVAVDFVIDNPQIVSAVTGGISVENNAYGVISNWNRSAGMTYDTVVSDPNNKTANPDWGAFRTWTPTFADSVSTGFTGSPTLTVAKYKFLGGAVEITLDWTATLAGAGTPTWIRCSVPTNLIPAANATVLGWLSIGGTWQAGMMAADTSGFIFFRKVDNSNFSAGAALTFRGALTYSI